MTLPLKVEKGTPSYCFPDTPSRVITGISLLENQWADVIEEIRSLGFVGEKDFGNQENLPLSYLNKHLLTNLARYKTLIPKPDEIIDYLNSYQRLAGILPTICWLALKEFGKDSEISLEIYNDPDFEDKTLNLCIRQEIYDEEIMERIRTVSRKVNQLLEINKDCVHIITDGRPPLMV